VLIALGAAALRLALGELVIEPLAAHAWPAVIAPTGAEAIPGIPGWPCWDRSLSGLPLRSARRSLSKGICLPATADLGGRSTATYWSGIVVVSVLFDYWHVTPRLQISPTAHSDLR
jgi:hypothetical protein